MASKPLSDKKIRRILRKQMKDEKKRISENSIKLPKEWEHPPKNLKGKDVGMWYREREKKVKLLKKTELVDDAEKRLSKKEKKDLKKLKSKKEYTESSSQCFKIGFDSIRENMIQEYLNSVIKDPPSFLLPQYEYLKKSKKKYNKSDFNYEQTEIQNDCSDSVGRTSLNVQNLLIKSQELYKTFPIQYTDEISISNIRKFLSNSEILIENVDNNSKLDIKYCHKHIQNDDFRYNDQDVLDSMDKYKHLEETTFKQRFMTILSQTIQSNLDKAVRYNTTLKKNKALDEELYMAFMNKQNNFRYLSFKKSRNVLPAFKMQKEILELINNNQIILISGETGCGKTTQIAQFILDDALINMNGSLCSIICTQPRRISAISVAERVANERAEILGKESIGYQIRLEKKVGRQRGAILYCTTGILLQHMQGDPALKKYSHIILDEIHERDALCDFVLAILKDIVTKRKDLKIILMSATLNAYQFSTYFYNCPMINIPGYTYPVEECFLEDVLALTKFTFVKGIRKKNNHEEDASFKKYVLPYVESLKKSRKYPNFVLEGLSNPDSEKINPDLIIQLLKYICLNQPAGAILIFVPGWEDINSIIRKINESENFPSNQYLIIPLHSMLPTAAQQTVFDRPPPGKKKIVIATNIAETSITINDVVYVIDCGKIKIKNYDVVNNISTLKPEFVSLANAKQRMGRAGRVQKGFCYHLFSRGREKALQNYPLPEMLRTRLEEVILNIKLLQLGKVSPFLEKVMDPPNPKAVSLALELLRQLNALDENENLTPLGFHLAKLPLDPQIGKMLLMGVTMSCLNPILSIAATLSYKDPFFLPMGEEKLLKERKLEMDNGNKSDHLIMAEVFNLWEIEENRGGSRGKHFCTHNFLTRCTLFNLRNLKSQFSRYLYEMGFLNNMNYKQANFNMNSNNVALVKAVICSGLYPNIAIIKRTINSKNRTVVLLRTSEDGNVSLHSKSVNTVQPDNFESNFLMYHEKLQSSCIFIYDTTMVTTLPLLFFCYDFFITRQGSKIIIQLNKDLRFICSRKTAELIVELKLRLSWLLEYKLSHPGQISWNENGSDIALLKVLTNLFTAENDQIMGINDNSTD